MLRIPNVIDERVALGDMKYATLAGAELEGLRLHVGGILLVRSNGNTEYIARCAAVDDQAAGMAYAV